LHAAWWQWAFSFPFSEHPLTPGSGATCASGQTGHVWFLGGVFNMTGTETRQCAIPSGTALAVAVADVECSTVESAPFSGTDPASLRACAAGVADPASLLFVGRAFAVLDDHSVPVRRAPSPVFHFSVPDGSILTCPCSGTSGLAVADGYMLLLHPLSVGTHELHFGGSFPNLGYSLNITYHLTVAPRGRAA
jgi:hypothetical protein